MSCGNAEPTADIVGSPVSSSVTLRTQTSGLRTHVVNTDGTWMQKI